MTVKKQLDQGGTRSGSTIATWGQKIRCIGGSPFGHPPYRHIPELRFYLLVHSQRPEITFYRRTEEDRWEIGQLDPGEVLEVHCVDAFGATLRFEDVYEDVSWPDDLGVGSPAGGGPKTPPL